MYAYQKLLARELLTSHQSSQAKGVRNQKKKIYTSRLREGLEVYLASTTSTASGTTNHRRLIRERLESHPSSNHRKGLGAQSRSNQRHDLETRPAVTTSSSFTNASDIPNITPSPTKAPGTGYSLWRGHRRRIGIKDSTPAAHSLCEYTWEMVACMVLTGEGRLGPDIWPETPGQVESMESMIRIIWGMEVNRRQKTSGTPDSLLSPTGKEARHTRLLLFCDWC